MLSKVKLKLNYLNTTEIEKMTKEEAVKLIEAKTPKKKAVKKKPAKKKVTKKK